MVARRKSAEDEIVVNLVTIKDRTNEGFFNQNSNLGLMQDQFVMQGIKLNYSFDESEKIHARGITTNSGWKIIIDRGLDIFQKYNTKDFFSVQARKGWAFEMTAIKV